MGKKRSGILVLILIVFAISVLLTACGQKGNTAVTPVKAQPAPSSNFDPAKYFADTCAACHGANAEGKGNAPALNKAATQHDKYFKTILNGKESMPSFKGKLTKEQIDQIISWLAQK